MACSPRFIIFFTISLTFLLNVPYNRSEAQTTPSYIVHGCSLNTSVYSPNSTYRRNLDTLLSTLASNTSDYVSGFGNSTVGQGLSKVNGLFLCRADVSAATCRECVGYGTQDMVEKCPGRKASIIWYDECMVRYSNNSILSIMREMPMVPLFNTVNVSDAARFASLLEETLNTILPTAAAGQYGRKFAVHKANFTANQTLYTLAQCTPDISATNCSMCLQDVSKELPTYLEGARILSPSCNVRYEIYPFYNETAVVLLSPPSPVPSPAPSPAPSPGPTSVGVLPPSPASTSGPNPPGQQKNGAFRGSVTVQAAAATLSVSFSLFFL